MSAFGQQQADQVNALRAEVKSLVVSQLKDALRLEKQQVSGNKGVLQERLISRKFAGEDSQWYYSGIK